ncbi:MAG TPA: SAM-dependent methyltransferase [Betaproteobacteria bacterium]|nr:SAM-dependent methyltransferase [Betaproteobacteria bacterium]
MAFKDHFSQQSAAYARYRPHYPAALFDYIAGLASATALAWDCGTGSGQVAAALAPRFARVVATDPSTNQIRHATPCPNVEYRVEAAERSSLADASADVATVAQALHWLDLPRFYAEAARVLKPGGVVAVWSYGLFRVHPAVDAVVDDFYRRTVGPYWPPERRLIDTGYRTLSFPFAEIAPPAFIMTAEWDLAGVIGYLSTWSAVRRYREQNGRDPLAALEAPLAAAWGSPRTGKILQWPVYLRVGRTP